MTALIETQLLIQMAQFQASHVIGWLQNLYKVVYIHIDVYQELTDGQLKRQVTRLIMRGDWVIFSPARLSATEHALYQAHLVMLTSAWLTTNQQALQRQQPISLLTQPSTLATLAANLTWDIPIICSDNPELTDFINHQDLKVNDHSKRPSRRLQQVTALQLSQQLAQRHLITPAVARLFYEQTRLFQPLRKSNSD